MRHCDLVSGLGRLKHAAAELREHWQAAKEVWTDQVSRDFEKNHLQQLPAQVTQVVAAVQQLADVLEQAEKELEDPLRGE